MENSSLKKTCTASLILLFLTLVFSGCVATSGRGTASDPTQVPALEPAALLKFSDVPTPAVFRFVPDGSYAFQNKNFRIGMLKYTGKANADQTLAFFKEQMPMYNWNTVNIIEYGSRVLSFEKGGESCVITITEKGSKIEITLSITPKSQPDSRKTADRPIK